MLLLPLLGLLSAIVLRADGAPGLDTIQDPPSLKIQKTFEERLEFEWKELKTEHTHDWKELIGAPPIHLCMQPDRALLSSATPRLPASSACRIPDY
jgi:hypothetical protein